jgi:hypothetical protein
MPMQVFISCSGKRSKHVAKALYGWLPNVIQSVKPWMAAENIDAGARWSDEVAAKLLENCFGIICLTKDNQTKPWIMFEAGALSKVVTNVRVVPYLIDMQGTDIDDGPLTQFQYKQANKKGTFDLICTINKLCDNKLDDDKLEKTFEVWWPDFEKNLTNLPEPESIQEIKRSSDDMIAEMLEIVREMARFMPEETAGEGVAEVVLTNRRPLRYKGQIFPFPVEQIARIYPHLVTRR